MENKYRDFHQDTRLESRLKEKALPSRILLKDVRFTRDVVRTADVVSKEIKEKA